MKDVSYFNENEKMALNNAGHNDVKKLQVEIPYDLHNRFKAECFLQGGDMKHTVIWLINCWLEKKAKSAE